MSYEDYEDFNELEQEVRSNGDVMTTSMKALREAAGYKKLGRFVTEEISDNLNQHGLGHFPEILPENQHAPVRIYKKGTQISKMIEAANGIGENYDKQLREKTGASAEVIQKIRALLDEGGSFI